MIELEQFDPSSQNIDANNDQLSLMRVNIENDSENISYQNKKILSRNKVPNSLHNSKSFNELKDIKLSADGQSGDLDDFKYFENKSKLESESKKLLEENIKKISQKKLDDSYIKDEKLKEEEDSNYMINNVEETRDKAMLYISSLKTLNKALKSTKKKESNEINKEVLDKKGSKSTSNKLSYTQHSITPNKKINSTTETNEINKNNHLINTIKSEKKLEKKHLEYELINNKLPLFSELMKKKYSPNDQVKKEFNDKLNTNEIKLIKDYYSKQSLKNLQQNSDIFKIKDILPSKSETSLIKKSNNQPIKKLNYPKKNSNLKKNIEVFNSNKNSKSFVNSHRKASNKDFTTKTEKIHSLPTVVIGNNKIINQKELMEGLTKNKTDQMINQNKSNKNESLDLKIKGLLKGTDYEHKEKNPTSSLLNTSNLNDTLSNKIKGNKSSNNYNIKENTEENKPDSDTHHKISEIDKFESYLKKIGAITRVKSKQDELNELFDKMKKNSSEREKELKEKELKEKVRKEKELKEKEMKEKELKEKVRKEKIIKNIELNNKGGITKKTENHNSTLKHNILNTKNTIKSIKLIKPESKLVIDNNSHKETHDNLEKVKLTKRVKIKKEEIVIEKLNTKEQKLSINDDLRNKPLQHTIKNKELNLETNNFNSYFKFDITRKENDTKKPQLNNYKNLTIEQKLLNNINNKLNKHHEISVHPKKKINLKRYESPQVIQKDIQQELKKEMKFKIDTTVFNNFLNKLRKSVPDNIIPKPKPQPTLKEFYENSRKIEENPNLISNLIEFPEIIKDLKKEKEETQKPLNLNSIFKEEFQAFIQKIRS